MDAFKNFFDNLKERLKTAWEEQQESPTFIAIKERYEELPPLAQKGVLWGLVAFGLILLFWWPVSDLTDSWNSSSQFEERRGHLKELLHIERDIAASPALPLAPPPPALKSQFDQKIAAAGVKPEQVKEASEVNPAYRGVESRGFRYRIDRVTIRQGLDIAYEIEHTDPSLKLLDLEFSANATDPHFYEVAFNVVNFSPKSGAPEPGSTGSAILDAVKKKGELPSGQRPTIPNVRGGP